VCHGVAVGAEWYQVGLWVDLVAGAECGQFPDVVNVDEVTSDLPVALLEAEAAHEARRAVYGDARGAGCPVAFVAIDEHTCEPAFLVGSARRRPRWSTGGLLAREQIGRRRNVLGPQPIQMVGVRLRHGHTRPLQPIPWDRRHLGLQCLDWDAVCDGGGPRRTVGPRR